MTPLVVLLLSSILAWARVGAAVAAAPVPPVSGDGSSALVAADFDGDGIPDLAVASSVADSIAIYLGRTDGSFPRNPARVLSTGAKAAPDGVMRHVALSAGDLNGDGKLDLVAVNMAASVVSVLLSKGDGSFSEPITTATLALPAAVALGDFDSDGKVDLAVAAQGRGKVSILPGTGDGHFRPSIDVSAGLRPTGLVAGDFGTSQSVPARDGKLDLAVTASEEGQIAILFGDGRASFSAPLKLVAPGAAAITAVDLNGDGVADLATANTTQSAIGINLGYDKGAGGVFGGQSAVMDFGAEMRPTHFAAADFDSDGSLDLAVAAESTASTGGGIFVLLNRPKPGLGLVFFAPPVFCALDTVPTGIVAAKFRGSAEATDIAVCDREGRVRLFSGNGNGGFTDCAAPLPTSAGAAQAATGAM